MPNRLRHIPDALNAAADLVPKGRRSFTVLLGLVVLGVAAAAPDLQADDSPTNPAKP